MTEESEPISAEGTTVETPAKEAVETSDSETHTPLKEAFSMEAEAASADEIAETTFVEEKAAE